MQRFFRRPARERFDHWGALLAIFAVLVTASVIQHATAIWFMRASAPPLVVSEAEAETPRPSVIPPLPPGSSYVEELPKNCEAVEVAHVSWRKCGADWYRPYSLHGKTVYVPARH